MTPQPTQTDPLDAEHTAATHEAVEALAYKPPVPSWALHRRLYNWTLALAEKRHATWALFGISFAESSCFPVPPDVLLAPLCLGNRDRAFWFATVTTVASVLGGIAGYLIGWGAWEATADFWFSTIPGFSQQKFDQVAELYVAYGVAVVFVAAFTPIPYKIFTIAAGVFSLNLPLFILASAIGRGARFFLVAGLLRWIGPKAEPFIDKYFNWLCIAMVVLGIGGVAALKFLH